MAYWLIKSEPDVFSWADQVARGPAGEPWTGVRNHTAKLNLMAMRRGDFCFFYHSNIGLEIVGIVEVVREAYPDPTAEKGPWVCVDMVAREALPVPVSLKTIKATPALAEMPLITSFRLSVQPVPEEHWRLVCQMGGLLG